MFVLKSPAGWSLHRLFSESRVEMNGHSSRSSRRERRKRWDSDRPTSQGSDRGEGEVNGRGSLKRKTARAAVDRIKLLEVSDDDDEEKVEEMPKRTSSRQAARAGKRSAVIQSSSDSDGENSSQGEQKRNILVTRQPNYKST